MSRLQRRHCGLALHFKTDPTETVALCFGYAKTLFWQRRHFGLARHFTTDPTKTVDLCFGYAKTLCWRADGRADERDNGVTYRRDWTVTLLPKYLRPYGTFYSEPPITILDSNTSFSRTSSTAFLESRQAASGALLYPPGHKAKAPPRPSLSSFVNMKANTCCNHISPDTLIS
jgi:hypothetical protein